MKKIFSGRGKFGAYTKIREVEEKNKEEELIYITDLISRANDIPMDNVFIKQRIFEADNQAFYDNMSYDLKEALYELPRYLQCYDNSEIISAILTQASPALLVLLLREFAYVQNPEMGLRKLLPAILNLDSNQRLFAFGVRQRIVKSLFTEERINDENIFNSKKGVLYVVKLLSKLRDQAEQLKTDNTLLTKIEQLNAQLTTYFSLPEEDQTAYEQFKKEWHKTLEEVRPLLKENDQCESTRLHLSCLISNKNFELKTEEHELLEVLNKFYKKANNLHIRNEETAYVVANHLYHQLSDSFLDYLSSSKTPEQFELLKNKWNSALDIATPELEKHRGWKNILANLTLLIVTLGTSALYSGYRSGGKNFLFPIQTESNSLKQLNEARQEMNEGYPKKSR